MILNIDNYNVISYPIKQETFKKGFLFNNYLNETFEEGIKEKD